MREKVKKVVEVLSNKIPGGEFEKIFDLALDLVLEKYDSTIKKVRKTSKVANPKTRKPSKALQREVSKRDGCQCTFVSHDGVRCSERKFLQYDHIIPVALGGLTELDNLRLLCTHHNQFEAERVLGFRYRSAKMAKSVTGNPGVDFDFAASGPKFSVFSEVLI